MASMRDFEQMEANLRATLGVFALARPGGEAREIGGVWLVSSRVEYPMFNAATLTGPVASAAQLAARLECAEAHYAAQRLPWSVWLCTDWLSAGALEAVDKVCANAGLTFVARLPGMQAERVAPPRRPLPHMEFQRVSDRKTREGFTRLMCQAFGVPYFAAREIYESEGTWRGGLAGYVGWMDGAIITCAATLAGAGVVGVYAVGTLPPRQRHGYAEAVMRHALGDTRERCGIERTILQSSVAGYSLYVRMGYKTVTSYIVFARN